MVLKKFITGVSATAAVTLSMVGVASAAPLNSNGSFETGVDPGVFTTLIAGDTTSITDWTVSAGTIDYIGTYWTASEGTDSLDLTGYSAGAVSKTFATVVGRTYKVTFDLAGNPAGGSTVMGLTVDAGAAPTLYAFDTTGKTLTDMGWTPQTFTFTATGTSTTLTFASQTPGFFGPALDNVVISDAPTDKDQCKKDGWKTFVNPTFKNQGDCVSYVQSSPNAKGNKADN